MLDALKEFWDTLYSYISQTVIVTFPLVNTILVIMAGCLGSMLYGKIKPHVGDILFRALGAFAILMGASYAWDSFFVLQTGQIETTGTLLVLFALLIGYGLGALFDVDRGMRAMGVGIYRLFAKPVPSAEQKATKKPVAFVKPTPPTHGVEGFVIATMLCALSAPTIRCAIESRATEDAIPLLIKLGFDVVVIFLLTALCGSTVTCAAAPMLLIEGILILIYTLWGDLLTPTLMNQLVLTGSVILVATGISMGLGKKVKTANFFPALLIPAIYGLIVLIAEKIVEAA